jgi:selenocysteine lyase/cysteine desulfurase
MDNSWSGTQSLPAAEASPGGGLPELLAEYPETFSLDHLRETDFSRVDRQGHVYLDWTGGGLYADRQIRRHADLLRASVLGNPHSSNPTSRASTELVESKSSGAVRVSLGLISNLADVEAFLAFLEEFLG